eukprot:scaffold6402_cov110-Isochrysis_galbana.AAC.2
MQYYSLWTCAMGACRMATMSGGGGSMCDVGHGMLLCLPCSAVCPSVCCLTQGCMCVLTCGHAFLDSFARPRGGGCAALCGGFARPRGASSHAFLDKSVTSGRDEPLMNRGAPKGKAQLPYYYERLLCLMHVIAAHPLCVCVARGARPPPARSAAHHPHARTHARATRRCLPHSHTHDTQQRQRQGSASCGVRVSPRAELRAADEERTRVSRGSADLVRDHASKLRIKII